MQRRAKSLSNPGETGNATSPRLRCSIPRSASCGVVICADGPSKPAAASSARFSAGHADYQSSFPVPEIFRKLDSHRFARQRARDVDFWPRTRFHYRQPRTAPRCTATQSALILSLSRFTGRTMDSHDTFPGGSGKLWPQFRKVTSPPMAISHGWRVHPVRRARLAGSSSACLKAPRFPGTGWSTATATFPLLARICSASARRCWLKVSRCPAAAISICSTIAGFTEGKKMPLGRGIDGLQRGRSIAAGDRYGRLLYRHQNQVGPVPSPIHHRLHGIGDKHHLTVNRNG